MVHSDGVLEWNRDVSENVLQFYSAFSDRNSDSVRGAGNSKHSLTILELFRNSDRVRGAGNSKHSLIILELFSN